MGAPGFRYASCKIWIGILLVDKDRNEIDFVIKGQANEVHIYECKINPEKFSSKALSKFRKFYPLGKNYCVSPSVNKSYKLRVNHFEVEFISTIV